MVSYTIAVSAVFIEQRRRALKRFLLLVVRHPILAKDDITKIFLSAGGQVREDSNQPL
jgi:sorting nexin-8